MAKFTSSTNRSINYFEVTVPDNTNIDPNFQILRGRRLLSHDTENDLSNYAYLDLQDPNTYIYEGTVLASAQLSFDVACTVIKTKDGEHDLLLYVDSIARNTPVRLSIPANDTLLNMWEHLDNKDIVRSAVGKICYHDPLNPMYVLVVSYLTHDPSQSDGPVLTCAGFIITHGGANPGRVCNVVVSRKSISQISDIRNITMISPNIIQDAQVSKLYLTATLYDVVSHKSTFVVMDIRDLKADSNTIKYTIRTLGSWGVILQPHDKKMTLSTVPNTQLRLLGVTITDNLLKISILNWPNYIQRSLKHIKEIPLDRLESAAPDSFALKDAVTISAIRDDDTKNICAACMWNGNHFTITILCYITHQQNQDASAPITKTIGLVTFQLLEGDEIDTCEVLEIKTIGLMDIATQVNLAKTELHIFADTSGGLCHTLGLTTELYGVESLTICSAVTDYDA